MLHDNGIDGFAEEVGFSPLAALTEQILKTMCMGPRGLYVVSSTTFLFMYFRLSVHSENGKASPDFSV